MKKEKLVKIEAVNRFGKIYSWSARNLFWKELPRNLVDHIQKELPHYDVKSFYENPEQIITIPYNTKKHFHPRIIK